MYLLNFKVYFIYYVCFLFARISILGFINGRFAATARLEFIRS